jgi:predicted phage terminase large subunit-like protein
LSKTYGLLLEPLRHFQKRHFGGIIFRQNYSQINAEGGLWDTSERFYPQLGAVGIRGSAEWRFPSGATIAFRHMEHDKDIYNWLGAQIPFIGFDQLEEFSEKQFFLIMASNRDPVGVCRPYIRATCNPKPGWLADFIQWWWNPETGYPIIERGGKLRYFVRVSNRLIWADTRQELEARHKGTVAKSVTFIPAFVEDNKALMKSDPGYMSSLLAQPLVERERWLHGNWKIQAAAGNIFKAEWFKIIEELPKGIVRWCRFWDLAATEQKANTDPDWTAGPLLGALNGEWFIADLRRFRKSPKGNEDAVRQTSQIDPRGTMIRMEEEGGASGKSLVDHYGRNVLSGFDFKGVKPLVDKVARAGAFSAAAENGRVYVLKGAWTMELLDELASFPEGPHDDIVDGLTGAMEALAGGGAFHDANWVVMPVRDEDTPEQFMPDFLDTTRR